MIPEVQFSDAAPSRIGHFGIYERYGLRLIRSGSLRMPRHDSRAHDERYKRPQFALCAAAKYGSGPG